MDKQDFRAMLQERKLTETQIEASIAVAERFEAYLADKVPTAETARSFSKVLIEEGINTRESYIALARYCFFIKNNVMYTAMMEFIDGSEVSGIFYKKVGDVFGKKIQEEVFDGFGIAPLEMPWDEKARYMHTILGRLEVKVGSEACKELLANSLRDLPDSYYISAREEYHQCKNIDEYIEKGRRDFFSYLETCKRDNLLHFTQEVTDEVIAFLRTVPEIRGMRQGDIVYEVKEPYQTKQYLAETDPVLKRYHYCHCPWAREAIKRGNVKLVTTFCNCSAGYHKRRWEVIFGQPLKAEVVESVLKGDDRCRFAIHLPEEAIPEKRL